MFFNSKNRNPLLLILLVLLVAFTGCGNKETGLTNGTYTASETGYGGDVTVKLTVEKGKVSAVEITGADETPQIGGAAIPTLEEELLKAKSADVEAVSGASATSKAVLAAAEQVFAEAEGTKVAEAPLKMADGTYSAAVWSFSTTYPLNVEVSIEDNKFTAISVGDNNDTAPILQTAIDYLIPRMIENQSVSIDSITGATSSSTAIKAATEECLVQAISAAGGDEKAIRNFYVKSEKVSGDPVKMETDVLVVGMGGSGIMTATRAAEAIYAANGNDKTKVNVLGIEKAAKYGGTGAITSMPMSINPPSSVASNGGEDYVDADVLKQRWIEYTEGDAKEWAIDYMMNVSGSVTDYLMDRGFIFGPPIQGLSDPVKAVVSYGGEHHATKSEIQTYYDSIMDHYVEIGGEYILETSATDLITDGSGKVVGVTAQNDDGTEYEIYADAVVLATGGYGCDAEMTEKYLSTEYYPLTGAPYNMYGMRTNDGTMLESAIQKGAATYNIGVPPMSHIGGAVAVMHDFPTTVLPGTVDFFTGRELTQSLNDIPMMLAIAPNALAVNKFGKRFVDETALSIYGNWQAGPRYYTLWSSDMINDLKTDGLKFSTLGLFINQGGWPVETPIDNIDEVMDAAIAHGIVVKADTIADLAKALNMDPAVLTETVTNYNTYCDTRENPADGITKSENTYDLFGNAIPSKYPTLEKVEGDGPYYAVVSSPWIYSSVGGLDINDNFEVLNKIGDPVGGLYAVGNDSIGVLLTEKKEYVNYGGAAQGWAFTSGYLTGAIVAEEVIDN